MHGWVVDAHIRRVKELSHLHFSEYGARLLTPREAYHTTSTGRFFQPFLLCLQTE